MGYKISKGFIPPSAVLNTAEGGSKKINKVNFFGRPI
jgi:hypothetical protein